MSKSDPKQKSGKTLDDFRAAHDKRVIVPAKIRKALAEMEEEHPENWEYELDFMRRAGVSQTDMGAFRSLFEIHVVEVGGKNPKKVWFASAKVAEKARAK